MAMNVHKYPLRVYYEDTDLAGIVYYANYMKFIERARTEWVRDMGVDQTQIRRDEGIVFAVRRVEADYIQPAKFDDQLCVQTVLREMRGAQLSLGQDVLRGDQTLFSAIVTLVALRDDGRPARLPSLLREALK
jgi:acyl-CoA thioester hydrolase